MRLHCCPIIFSYYNVPIWKHQVHSKIYTLYPSDLATVILPNPCFRYYILAYILSFVWKVNGTETFHFLLFSLLESGAVLFALDECRLCDCQWMAIWTGTQPNKINMVILFSWEPLHSSLILELTGRLHLYQPFSKKYSWIQEGLKGHHG